MDQNYSLSAEVIGPEIRVYQDRALVFAVTDSSINTGTVGLDSSGHAGTRFGHLRVDDYQKGAPTPYRFSFTSSLYTNFFHHLHSFQDESWTQAFNFLDLNRYAPAMIAPPAGAPIEKVEEAEWRAYNNFINDCFGPAVRQLPKTVEATKVVSNGNSIAVLVESPEPIVWTRDSVEPVPGRRARS